MYVRYMYVCVYTVHNSPYGWLMYPVYNPTKMLSICIVQNMLIL